MWWLMHLEAIIVLNLIIPSYEGEALAAVWAIAPFRPYLYGQKFTLVTDYQPLKWLMESDKFTGKLARWALLLQEYDFEVVH
jgi:hypothetical protein